MASDYQVERAPSMCPSRRPRQPRCVNRRRSRAKWYESPLLSPSRNLSYLPSLLVILVRFSFFPSRSKDRSVGDPASSRGTNLETRHSTWPNISNAFVVINGVKGRLAGVISRVNVTINGGGGHCERKIAEERCGFHFLFTPYNQFDFPSKN